MTDARNGTTTLVYNNADFVATNTTPNPGDGSPESTVTTYNNMLQDDRRDPTRCHSGQQRLFAHRRIGTPIRLPHVSGGIQLRLCRADADDDQLERITPAIPARRVTTWTYDPYRGFLTNKTYDGGTAGHPTPTWRRAVWRRAWARGITTTYGMTTGGDLTIGVLSDGVTPSVGYAYDRLDRQNSITWTNITDTLTYNLANQLQIESFSGGILNGLSVTNGYDSDLRRTMLAALSGSSQLLSATYGYDNASRLASVTDGNNNSATYSYLANSPLVSQITFKQSGATRMTTTKQWDYLNRLTQISSAPSAAYTSPLTFNYNYNPANQRTKDTLADGSYWIYGYDSLGQVTNGCKYFSRGTPVPGQQFDYTFDTIGNRTQTESGGDTNGANLRVANYYANNLNQITNRDIPGTSGRHGRERLATNSVTVNGQTAYRNQEYFRGWRRRTTRRGRNGRISRWQRRQMRPGTCMSQGAGVFEYDADGNLTNDGRWAYTWDGENRLVTMMVEHERGAAIHADVCV